MWMVSFLAWLHITYWQLTMTLRSRGSVTIIGMSGNRRSDLRATVKLAWVMWSRIRVYDAQQQKYSCSWHSFCALESSLSYININTLLHYNTRLLVIVTVHIQHLVRLWAQVQRAWFLSSTEQQNINRRESKGLVSALLQRVHSGTDQPTTGLNLLDPLKNPRLYCTLHCWVTSCKSSPVLTGEIPHLQSYKHNCIWFIKRHKRLTRTLQFSSYKTHQNQGGQRGNRLHWLIWKISSPFLQKRPHIWHWKVLVHINPTSTPTILQGSLHSLLPESPTLLLYYQHV